MRTISLNPRPAVDVAQMSREIRAARGMLFCPFSMTYITKERDHGAEEHAVRACCRGQPSLYNSLLIFQ
jgi:hypothetical protein